MQNIKELINGIVNCRILADEPMKNHTSFKIGGNADFIAEPENENQIIALLKVLAENNIPYFVMGNGSNILVGDKGIRGVVIKLADSMSDCSVNGNEISAGSGIKLSRLAKTALDNSLGGMEFASGIPGTLGGAVYMNAGAYGGEMKDIVKSVTYIDTKTLDVKTIDSKDCDFDYRHSVFSSGDKIITGATLKLDKKDKNEIAALMKDLSERRTSKQPLDKPSAGSTFKRPTGYFAGTLIQDAGLKGKRIGGAEVSTKHSGFIINADGATARDVLDLVEYVKKEVKDKFGVELEPEIKTVGEF